MELPREANHTNNTTAEAMRVFEEYAMCILCTKDWSSIDRRQLKKRMAEWKIKARVEAAMLAHNARVQ